jgi:hypothetical protein
MGLLGLGILWVNTLLVALASVGTLRSLGRRLGHMRRDGVIEGEAVGDEPLAVHEIEQIGRRASDDGARQAILFHDRGFRSRVLGGVVRVEGDELSVAAEVDRAEVWIERDAQRKIAACPSSSQFDEAYRMARKVRGFERTVRSEIAAGQRVWIHARRREDTLVAPEDAPLLVAAIDPRRWCRHRVLLLAGFVVVALAIAAAITLLALTPPLFGTLSTAGAAIGLAYFLLVQPAGVAMRDAARVPSLAFLRGSWVKTGSEGRGGPAKDEELVAD